jgi:hypothetical protein
MQFIQEKLSQQGRVGWAETRSNLPGVTYRNFVSVADVMADPEACTLYITETFDETVDMPKGKTLSMGGKQLGAEDLRGHKVETDTISFKQIEHVGVVKIQDVHNQQFVQAAHPEITATVTPPVFFLGLSSSNALAVTSHTSTTSGGQAPVEKDVTNKSAAIAIRDEDTANRLAKAMTHAMELCGGGVAKKELF